jgi:hypothetical protein
MTRARCTHDVAVTCAGWYTAPSRVMQAQQSAGYCQPRGITSSRPRHTSSTDAFGRLTTSWTL